MAIERVYGRPPFPRPLPGDDDPVRHHPDYSEHLPASTWEDARAFLAVLVLVVLALLVVAVAVLA